MSPEGEPAIQLNPLSSLVEAYLKRFGVFPPTYENLRRRATQLDVRLVGGQQFLEGLRDQPFILAPYHDGGLLRIIPMDMFIYRNLIKVYSEKVPAAVAMTDLNLILPKCFTKPLVRLVYSSIKGINIIQIEIGDETQTSQYRCMIQKAMSFTADGSVLIIFPTGRLSWEFNPQETYHRGTALLARYCEVPILPACTIGIETWTQQSPIYVAIGQPISPGTNRRDDQIITEILRQQINSLHESLENHLSTVTS